MEWWKELQATPWGEEDTDIFMAVVGCGLPSEKIMERLAFIEASRGDNEASKEAAATFVSRAFQHIPRKKNTRDVMNLWKLISKNMQHTPSVAFAALQAGAITFSQLHEPIRNDKECLLQGLRNNAFNWNSLPHDYKKDVDYALVVFPEQESFDVYHGAVINKERLWIELITHYPDTIDIHWWQYENYAPPISVRSNHDLMLKAITICPGTAAYISDSLAKNLESVQSFLQCNHHSFLHMKPNVYQNFPFLMTIEKIRPFVDEVQSSNYGTIWNLNSNLLCERIPTHHWNNEEFVRYWLSSTKRHRSDYGKISKKLWDDRNFVMKLIVNGGFYRGNINSLISQRLWNDRSFVLEFLSNGACCTKGTHKKIPQRLWNDRGFVLEFNSQGGQINDQMKKFFLDEEEIILEYTKQFTGDSISDDYNPNSTFHLWNCLQENNPCPIIYASDRLKKNKAFVRQLISHWDYPIPFLLILPYDNYTLLVACAKQGIDSSFCINLFDSLSFDGALKFDFYRWIRGNLQEYECFFKGILCGASSHSTSPLTMLHHCADIKRHIGSYLDFPMGEELQQIFQAGINLDIDDGFNPLR